ncbi:MAG: HAMP domain-containing protein [Streptosporangiales bacterium]|nr:HAMP domain-containing protein [Streptosporangiales bacterium]
MGSTTQSILVRSTVTAAVVSAVLTGFVCVLLMVGVWLSYAEELWARQDAAARKLALDIGRNRLPGTLASPDRFTIKVYDSSGRLRAATPGARALPRPDIDRPTDTDSRTEGRFCTAERCSLVAALRAFGPSGTYDIYVSTPQPGLFPRPIAATVIGACGVLVVLVLTGVIWLNVRRTVARIDGIREELAEITATDLGRRMPRARPDDEIGRLAATINRTLDRLESAVARQRSFASDASHELRSPLTALRTELELARMYPDSTNLHLTVDKAMVNVERLSMIVSDLLELTRLEADPRTGHERVDLGLLVTEELRYRRAVEMEVDLRAQVIVEGDRLRLSRLLTNLLDNAERHAESKVTILLARDDGEARLEVIDDGHGIPREDRERVFERFTRLDEGRSRDTGGSGLGLAIARDVARMHGGTLTVEDSHRGARFVLRLPEAN